MACSHMTPERVRRDGKTFLRDCCAEKLMGEILIADKPLLDRLAPRD